jgi:hypothetical protein
MPGAKTLLSLAILGALTLPAPALALAQTAPASPCADSEIHRAFDFWIGEWNVYAPDGGPYQGKNSITLQPGGRMIWEHWEGAGGSVGDSMNFFDPFSSPVSGPIPGPLPGPRSGPISGESGAWRQIWVSPAFVIDYAGGPEEDGSMFLSGEIHYLANDQRLPFTGRWTAQEDGSVIQHFQQADGEGNWSDWFIGHYVRMSEDPRAQEAEAARGD